MDSHYDNIEAAKCLEELALDRYNSADNDIQLSHITSSSTHYEARQTLNNWTLVHINTNEEVIGAFQGIIQKKDIPPFNDKISPHSRHIHYLRQSLTITGLNTPTYQKAISAVLEIHTLLGRAVGIDNVQTCGMVNMVNGAQVCKVSNRYFTPRILPGVLSNEVALTPDIDPHGYLAEAASKLGFYHSEENAVAYFRREGTNDGDYKYIPTQPANFSIGDIVEIQASFVVFSMKDKKYKTAMILRSIAMLDGQFTQARIANKIRDQGYIAPQITLKRKIGYGNEIVSGTRSKFQEMEIEEKEENQIEDVKGSKENEEAK